MENRRGGLLSCLKNCHKKRLKEEKLSEYFVENGSLLLKELISTSNGTYGIPIRNFSVQDLLTATNNFDEHNEIGRDGVYTLYKGLLEGRQIVVKKFKIDTTKYAIRDVAIMAQMSIHNNVLRLLGVCLEDEAISLVAKYAGERLLSDCTIREPRHNNNPLSWKCRLRAANQIANLLTYLHTALPRPIVHRDVKPSNFIIDQCGMVKLFDFSLSITIPLGESRVEAEFAGTRGFIDPEYFTSLSLFVTEKTDVYSFGVLLLMLLTGQGTVELYGDDTTLAMMEQGKSFVENDRFFETVDPNILGDGGGTEKEHQLRAFAEVALRCIESNGDDRPEMIEVAKELWRIERSIHA